MVYRALSSRSDFIAHLQTVATSDWGGWLFECRNRDRFMKKWKESSTRKKQEVVNSMLEELVPVLFGSLRLFKSTEDSSVDIFGFHSESTKSFVIISFDKSYSEMRAQMICVREDVSDEIKRIYDKCLATEFYVAHVINPKHLALIVDACTSNGQYSFRGGNMDIVLGILKSLFYTSPVEVQAPSETERNLHIAGTVPLGKEKEICAFSPRDDDEKFRFIDLNAGLHKIEINGNKAVMEQRQLEFYRVGSGEVVEYLSGHENYTELYVGPLYFNSTYDDSRISIRVWPYETTFYGGSIERTTNHFHLSIRLL